jgi:hypothetical protein
MERKLFLLVGKVLPTTDHILKVIKKFDNYIIRDMAKGIFNREQYYEIEIAVEYLGDITRKNLPYTPVTAIKKEYYQKLLKVFNDFSGELIVCSDNHGHPYTNLKGIEYEGYCYVSEDENENYYFLADYTDTDGKCFKISDLDWYSKVPTEKRWLKVSAKKSSNKVFKEWVNVLISTYEK